MLSRAGKGLPLHLPESNRGKLPPFTPFTLSILAHHSSSILLLFPPPIVYLTVCLDISQPPTVFVLPRQNNLAFNQGSHSALNKILSGRLLHKADGVIGWQAAADFMMPTNLGGGALHSPLEPAARFFTTYGVYLVHPMTSSN